MNSQETVKVIIVVSGGVVQDIFGNRPNVEIELFNCDDLSELGPAHVQEAEKRLQAIVGTFHRLPIGTSW